MADINLSKIICCINNLAITHVLLKPMNANLSLLFNLPQQNVSLIIIIFFCRVDPAPTVPVK